MPSTSPSEREGAFVSESHAQAAVDHYKAQGVWPGIIHRADGSCDLTYAPDSYTPRHDRVARGLDAYDMN